MIIIGTMIIYLEDHGAKCITIEDQDGTLYDIEDWIVGSLYDIEDWIVGSLYPGDEYREQYVAAPDSAGYHGSWQPGRVRITVERVP